MKFELDGRSRVIIEGITPQVEGGRFPAKRVVGDVVRIEADVFADGHDVLAAVVRHRHEAEKKAREARMIPLVNDRWRAEIEVSRLGIHWFSIEAWVDHFLTWHRDLRKRVNAQVDHFLTWHRDLRKRVNALQSDLDVQLLIGLELIRAAAKKAGARDRRKLETFIRTLESDDPLEEKIEEMWSEDLLALMWRNGEHRFATRSECGPRAVSAGAWGPRMLPSVRTKQRTCGQRRYSSSGALSGKMMSVKPKRDMSRIRIG